MGDGKFAKNGIRDRNVMSSWAGAHLAHGAGEEREIGSDQSRRSPDSVKFACEERQSAHDRSKLPRRLKQTTGISSRVPVFTVTSYRSFLATPTSPYALLTHSRQNSIPWIYRILSVPLIHPTYK
jgi:hypothetical protein